MNKLIKAPFGIAGASVGLGIIGESLNSEPLTQAGQTAGKFISPAINITMGRYLVNQLRKFKKL